MFPPIHVSRSFLPPIEEYVRVLRTVWDSHLLTNGGPLLLQLIGELNFFLHVSHLLVTANGVLSLQLAIKALGLSGAAITTPFSCATSAAIVWERCPPSYHDLKMEQIERIAGFINRQL